MKKLRENGLSLVILAVFAACMAAQVWAGRLERNEERRQHGEPSLSLPDYLRSGHFWEATAENWESEFLQMAAYVLLTVGLYQKGSSESKKPGEREAVDRDPRNARGKALANAPWPVRRRGWILRLYENSLSIAFVALFLASFWMHALGGARAHSEEEVSHGGEPISVTEYLSTPKFWFESFQNWQSEFLALVAMVVLSIWLRQRGSPESKPVDAPHAQTGTE
jgi:membrane protein implicated in regulation of membrane protease activity